jgi:hypothetical protein
VEHEVEVYKELAKDKGYSGLPALGKCGKEGDHQFFAM